MSYAADNNIHKATLIGMMAVLMWSTTIGLFRSISEIFGPIGGAASIFSVAACFACLLFGLPKPRDFSRSYLCIGGALFVGYEISLALSLGFALNRDQALELGMINYLWPSLTILLAVIAGQQRGSWLLLPAICLCFAGIFQVMKGDNAWSIELFRNNILSNPLAYTMAFAAAFLWAIYSVFTRRFGSGKNAVPLFLMVTASTLWIKYALSSEPALVFNLAGVVQVLLLGVLMATAYTCWNHGIQHGNITLLAAASYFTPIFAAALACVWLGINPGIGFLYGVLMVTTGSLICWWLTRRKH